eukprot:jgi/Galph1/3256/GphlegSOOS_G1940.1
MTTVTKDETPVVVLCSWCLRWKKNRNSLVIYGKKLVNETVEEKFWRTSSVAKAFTPFLVATRHKSIYSLVGELNWRQSDLNISLLAYFRHGFPSNWKEILNNQCSISTDPLQASKNFSKGCCEVDSVQHVENPVAPTIELFSEQEEESINDNSYNTRNRHLRRMNTIRKADQLGLSKRTVQSSEHKKRGQSETEKLSLALRYTGWKQ